MQAITAWISSGPSGLLYIQCLAQFVCGVADENLPAANAYLTSRELSLSFCNFNTPYQWAKKDTLANWVRHVLKHAAIDPGFGVHSVRGASTSKCIRKGLPWDQILRAGSWSSDSVFRKHYSLPPWPYSGIDAAVLSQSHWLFPRFWEKFFLTCELFVVCCFYDSTSWINTSLVCTTPGGTLVFRTATAVLKSQLIALHEK